MGKQHSEGCKERNKQISKKWNMTSLVVAERIQGKEAYELETKGKADCGWHYIRGPTAVQQVLIRCLLNTG